MTYEQRSAFIQELNYHNDVLHRFENDHENAIRDLNSLGIARIDMLEAIDDFMDTLLDAHDRVHQYRIHYENQVRAIRNRMNRHLAGSTNNRVNDVSIPSYGLACLPKPKVKALKKTDMESNADDLCGICLETPLRKNTIQMNCCNHSFCKSCMDTYVANALTNSQFRWSIQCPMCRHTNIKYTVFRERKVPVRKPKPAAPQVIDDVVDPMADVAI